MCPKSVDASSTEARSIRIRAENEFMPTRTSTPGHDEVPLANLNTGQILDGRKSRMSEKGPKLGEGETVTLHGDQHDERQQNRHHRARPSLVEQRFAYEQGSTGPEQGARVGEDLGSFVPREVGKNARQ